MQTDTPGQHFLPSEICRLVLGFLQEGGYSRTYQVFLKECVHLREYDSLLRKGQQYPTTIMGLSLLVMLEEYATLKLAQHATNLDTSTLLSTPRNAGTSTCWQTGQSMRTSQRQRTRALHRHKKGLPSRPCARSITERSWSGRTLGHASSSVSANMGPGLLETSSSEDSEDVDVGDGEGEPQGLCTSTPTGTGSAASLNNTGPSQSDDTPVSGVSSSISNTSGFHSDTGAPQGNGRLTESLDRGSRGEAGRSNGVRLTSGHQVSAAEGFRGERSGVVTEGSGAGGGAREFRVAGLTRTLLAHSTPVGSLARRSQDQQLTLQTGSCNDSGPAALAGGEKDGSCDPSSSMEAASKRRKKPPRRRAESQGEVTATGSGKDPVTKMINSSRFVKTLVDNINTCLYDSHKHTHHQQQQQTSAAAAATTSVTDDDCTAPVSKPAASTAGTVVSDTTSLEEEFDFLNKDMTQDAVSNIINMSSTDPIFKELFDIFNTDGEELNTKHSGQNDSSELRQGTASSGIREGLHTPPHCSAETDEAMTGFPAPLTMPSSSPSPGNTATPSQSSSRPHPAPLTFSTECIDLTSMSGFPSIGDFPGDQGSSVSADSQPVMSKTSGLGSLGAENPDSTPGGSQDRAQQGGSQDSAQQAQRETDSAESLKATALWWGGATGSQTCQPTDQCRHQTTSEAVSLSEDNQRSILTTAEQTSTVVSQYSVFQNANITSPPSGARKTEVSKTGNLPVTQTHDTEAEEETSEQCSCSDTATELSENGKQAQEKETTNLDKIPHSEKCVSCFFKETEKVVQDVLSARSQVRTEAVDMEEGCEEVRGRRSQQQQDSQYQEMETGEICDNSQLQDKDTCSVHKNHSETQLVDPAVLPDETDSNTDPATQQTQVLGVLSRSESNDSSANQTAVMSSSEGTTSTTENVLIHSEHKGSSEGITSMTENVLIHSEHKGSNEGTTSTTENVLIHSEHKGSSEGITSMSENVLIHSEHKGSSEGTTSTTDNVLIHSERKGSGEGTTSMTDNVLIHSEHNYFTKEIGEPTQGRPTYVWDEVTNSASESSFPEGQGVSDSEPLSPHRSRWGQLAKVAALDDSSTDPQVVFDGTQSGAFVIGANSSHRPPAPAVSLSEDVGVAAAVTGDTSGPELTSLTLRGPDSEGAGVMENCPCLESEISDENGHGLAFHTQASGATGLPPVLPTFHATSVTVLPPVLPTFHASAGTSTVLNPGTEVSDSSQLAVGKSRSSLEMIPEPEHSQSESWGLPQSDGDIPRTVAVVPVSSENSEGLVSTLVLSSLMKLSDFKEPQCFESDLAEVRTAFPETPQTSGAGSAPHATTQTCLPAQQSSMAKTSQTGDMSDVDSERQRTDTRPCPLATGEVQAAVTTSWSSVTAPHLSAVPTSWSSVTAPHLSAVPTSCSSVTAPHLSAVPTSWSSVTAPHLSAVPTSWSSVTTPHLSAVPTSWSSVTAPHLSALTSGPVTVSCCVASSVSCSVPTPAGSGLHSSQSCTSQVLTGQFSPNNTSCVSQPPQREHLQQSDNSSQRRNAQSVLGELPAGERMLVSAQQVSCVSSDKLSASTSMSSASFVSSDEFVASTSVCPVTVTEASVATSLTLSSPVKSSSVLSEWQLGTEATVTSKSCVTLSSTHVHTSPLMSLSPTRQTPANVTESQSGGSPLQQRSLDAVAESSCSVNEASAHPGQSPNSSGHVTDGAGSDSMCRKVQTETQTTTDGALQEETRQVCVEVPLEKVSAPAVGDLPSQSLLPVRSLENPRHVSTCSVLQEREDSSNQDGHRPKPKTCDATNTSCEEKTNVACVQDANRTDSAHESGVGVKENAKCQGSSEISTGPRTGKKGDLTWGPASSSESFRLASSPLRKEDEVSENLCDDQNSPVNKVAVDIDKAQRIDKAQHMSSHTPETHLQKDKRTVKKCRLEGDTCIIKPPSCSSNCVNSIDHQVEKTTSQNSSEIQLQLGRPSTDLDEGAEPRNPDKCHTRHITDQDSAAHHHSSSDCPHSVTTVQTARSPLPPHTPPRPRGSPKQSDVQFHTPPRAPVGTAQHGGTRTPRCSFPSTPSKYYSRTPPRGTPSKYYPRTPSRGTPSKYYPRTPPRGTPAYSPLKSPYSPVTAAAVSQFLSPRRKQLLSEPIPEEVFDEISHHSDSNLSDAGSVHRPASACSNPDGPDRQMDVGGQDSSHQCQTLPRTRSQSAVVPSLDSASRPSRPVTSNTSSGQKVVCPSSEWPAPQQDRPGQPSTPSPGTSSSSDLQHFRAVGTVEGPGVPHATTNAATLERQSQGKWISVGDMLASTDDSSKHSATIFYTHVSVQPAGEGGGAAGSRDTEKSRMDREKELSPSDVFITAGVSEEACRTNISMPILPLAVTQFLNSQIEAGELQVPMDFTNDLTLLKTPTTTPEKQLPRKRSPRSPRRGSSNQLSTQTDQLAPLSRKKSTSPKKRVRRRILANESTESPSKGAQLVRGPETGLTTNPSPHLRHFASVSQHNSPQPEDSAVDHSDHAAATEGSVGMNHKPKLASSKAAAAATTETSRKVVPEKTERTSPVPSSSDNFSIHSCTSSSELESSSDDDIPLSEVARKLSLRKQAAPVKASTDSVKSKPSEAVSQARCGTDTANDRGCDTDDSYGSPDLSLARPLAHDGDLSMIVEESSSQRSVIAATHTRTETPLGQVPVSNKPITASVDTSSRKLPLKKRPIGRKDLRMLWAETCGIGTAGLPGAGSDTGGKTADTTPGELARKSVQEEVEERGHSALSKASHSSSSSVEVDICELSEEEGGSSTREQLPLLQSVRKKQAIIKAKKCAGKKKKKLAVSKSHCQVSLKNSAPVNDNHSATPSSSDGPSKRKSPSKRKRDRLRLKKKVSTGTCDKVSAGGDQDGVTRSGHRPEKSALSERKSGSAETDALLVPGSTDQAAAPSGVSSGVSSGTARGSPSDSATPPTSIRHIATPPTSIRHIATPPTSIGHMATPPASVGGQTGPGGRQSQSQGQSQGQSYISVHQPEVVGIQKYGPYRRIKPTLLSTTTTSYFPGLSREQSLTGQSPLDMESVASPAFSVFSSAPSPMTSELSAGLFSPSPLPPQSWPQSPFPQPSLSASTAVPCAPAAKTTSVTSQSFVGCGGMEVSSAGSKRLTSSSDAEQFAGKVTGETAVEKPARQSSHTKSVKEPVKESSHTKSVKEPVKESSHTMLSSDTTAGKKLDPENAQKSSMNPSQQNNGVHCHSTTDTQKSGRKKRNSTQKATVSSASVDQHTTKGVKSRSKRAVCQKSSAEDEQNIVSSDQVHSNNKIKSDRKPTSKISTAHHKHSVDTSRHKEPSTLDDTDLHEEKKPNSKTRTKQERRKHSKEAVASKGRKQKSGGVQKASTETAAEEEQSGVNVGQVKEKQSGVNVGQESVSGPEQPVAEVEAEMEGGSLQQACDSFETEQAVKSIQELSASGHDSDDLTSVSVHHQQVTVERSTESGNADHAMMHGDNAMMHETDLGPGSYGSELDRNEGISTGQAMRLAQEENERIGKEILIGVGTTEGEAHLARDWNGMAEAPTKVRGDLLLSKQQGVNSAEWAGSLADCQLPDLVSASSEQGSGTAPSAASSRKRKHTSPVGALCKKARINNTAEDGHSQMKLGASFKQPLQRRQNSDREKYNNTGDLGTASHLLSMPFLGDVSRSPVKVNSLASKKSNYKPDSVVDREEEERTPANTIEFTRLAGTEGRVPMLDSESVLNQFSSLLSQVEREQPNHGTAPPPDQQGGSLPHQWGPLHDRPGEFQQMDSDEDARNPEQLANPSVTKPPLQQIQTAGGAGFVGSESVMDRFLDKFSSLLKQLEGKEQGSEALDHVEPDSAACGTAGHPQRVGKEGGQLVQPLEDGPQPGVTQPLYPASLKLGQLAQELQNMRSARYSARTQKRNEVRIRDGLVPKRRSTNRGSQNRRWRKNSQGSVRSAVLVSTPVLVNAGSSIVSLDITDSGGSPVKTPGSGRYRPILPKVTLQGKGWSRLPRPAVLPMGGLPLAPPVVTPTSSVSTPTATSSVSTLTPTSAVSAPAATSSVSTLTPTSAVSALTGVSPVFTPAKPGAQSGSCPVAASTSVPTPPGVPAQGVSSLNPLDAAVWSVLPELAVGMPAPQLQQTHTVQDDDHEDCMQSEETATMTHQTDCVRENDLLEGTSPQPLVIDDNVHSGTKSSQTQKAKNGEPSAQNQKEAVRQEKVSKQSMKKREAKGPQQGRVVKQNHQKQKTSKSKASKQLLPVFNAMGEKLVQQHGQKSASQADAVTQAEGHCSPVLPLSPHTVTGSESGTDMDSAERDGPVNSMSAVGRDGPLNLVSASVVPSGPSVSELSELPSASQSHSLNVSVDCTPGGTSVLESSVREGNGCEVVTAVQEGVPVSSSLSMSAASHFSEAGGVVPCGSSPPRDVDVVADRAVQGGVSVSGTGQQTRLSSASSVFLQPVLPVTCVSQPVSSVISSASSATQRHFRCDVNPTAHSTSTTSSHTDSVNHHPHPSPSHTDTVLSPTSVKTSAHPVRGLPAGGEGFQSPRREVAQVLASMDAVESERRGSGAGGGTWERDGTPSSNRDRDRTSPLSSAGSSPTNTGRLSSINLDKFLNKVVHHRVL